MKSPDCTSLVDELQTYLHDREIEKGFRALDIFFSQRESLFAGVPQEIALLFSMAQWVDLGYVVRPKLETMMSAFLEVDQTKLLLEEFLQLRMVQAFCSMRSMQYEKAIFLLETTLGAGESLMSTYQQFVRISGWVEHTGLQATLLNRYLISGLLGRPQTEFMLLD